MKIILSHPTGNANVKAAVNALLNAKMLFEFHTSIACFPNDVLYRLGRIPFLSEIRRRSFTSNLKAYTKTNPWQDIGRLMATKTKFHTLTHDENAIFSIDKIYTGIDKRIAKRLENGLADGLGAVYAYEDGAIISFLEAKRLHMKCYYELPIGYWRIGRNILEAERQKWPEWAATITNFEDSEKKLAKKDTELRLADKIVVASQFTANSLKDFPGTLAPVKIVPYAFPEVQQDRPYQQWHTKRRIKLLFVGGLSQRKGIADLFTVAGRLANHIELTIVGRKVGNDCAALDAALSKHTWIPTLPHSGILKLMREHDILVFPSLFEGFGLVITEAMSQGTPVITTERTAGPDIIRHNENGWLIRAGITEDLHALLTQLLATPHLITEVGQNAMKTAKKRSWEIYEKEFINAIL